MIREEYAFEDCLKKKCLLFPAALRKTWSTQRVYITHIEHFKSPHLVCFPYNPDQDQLYTFYSKLAEYSLINRGVSEILAYLSSVMDTPQSYDITVRNINRQGRINMDDILSKAKIKKEVIWFAPLTGVSPDSKRAITIFPKKTFDDLSGIVLSDESIRKLA